MFIKVCCIILVYFLIGALALWRINSGLNKDQKKAQWIKYGMYLLIVSGIVSVIHFTASFKFLAILILLSGLAEIVRLILSQRVIKPKPAMAIVALYLSLCTGFYLFSKLDDTDSILFIYTIVFTFDGFSQIVGQIFGKTPLAPTISPNKTIEGSVGGALSSIATAFILTGRNAAPLHNTLLVSVIVVISSLAGDLLASALKRFYGAKDFGQLIPGHGGVLDRFDSFITAGAVYYIFANFNFTI